MGGTQSTGLALGPSVGRTGHSTLAVACPQPLYACPQTSLPLSCCVTSDLGPLSTHSPSRGSWAKTAQKPGTAAQSQQRTPRAELAQSTVCHLDLGDLPAPVTQEWFEDCHYPENRGHIYSPVGLGESVCLQVASSLRW